MIVDFTGRAVTVFLAWRVLCEAAGGLGQARGQAQRQQRLKTQIPPDAPWLLTNFIKPNKKI